MADKKSGRGGTGGWNVAEDARGAASIAVTAGLDQELDIGVDDFVFAELAAGGWGADPAVPAAVERAVRNALRLKFASGLFDRGGAAVGEGGVAPGVRREHEALALAAVHQGVVLLANANGTLPFDRGARGVGRIAVVGPLGDGPDAQAAMLGGYGGAPGEATQTLAAAAQAEGWAQHGVVAVRGASPCNATVNRTALADAVAAARAADVAIVAVGDSGGLECQTCGEGRDRTSLDLPGSQLALLRGVLDGVDPARTTVVLVLIHGRPVTFGADGACGRLEPCFNGLLHHPALGAVVAASKRAVK